MLKKQYKILILIEIGAILDNHLAIFFYLFIWYLSFFKHIIIRIHTCWFWIYVLPKYMPIYESYINLILCISMELCYYVLDVSCLSSVDQESLKWWKKIFVHIFPMTVDYNIIFTDCWLTKNSWGLIWRMLDTWWTKVWMIID